MMSAWKNVACVLVLACAMAPGQAMAQDEGLQVGEGILSLSGGLGLTVVGLVTVAVATPFLILSTTGDALTSSGGGGGTAALEEYLRSHEVELRQDTAVGSGETVDELAKAFGVGDEASSRAAFGRASSSSCARPEALTQERAAEFVGLVVEGMTSEPALAR